jgi:hypothetical protein
MRWLLLLILLGCEAAPPEGRFECESDTDCPDDMVCRVERNRCYYTQADGGSD